MDKALSLIFSLLLAASQGILAPIMQTQASSGGTPPSVTSTCQSGTFAANPSRTCVFSPNPASGDILLYAAFTQTGATINAPTGCPGTSWGSAIATNNTTNPKSMYLTSTTGGACTITGTATDASSVGFQIVGIDITNAIATTDGTPTISALAFCTSCTGPTVTTSLSNGDICVNINMWSGTHAFTAASPYSPTDLNVQNAGSGDGVAVTHIVQSTAGATTPTWTSAGVAYGSYLVCIEP